MSPRSSRAAALLALALLLGAGCRRAEEAAPAAASVLHLDRELGSARRTSAPAPARTPVAWSFAEPRPEWRTVSSSDFPGLGGVALERGTDGARLDLLEPETGRQRLIVGGIAADVPESPLDAWAGLLVRARSHARMAGVGAACNVASRDAIPGGFHFFTGQHGTSPVFNDGSVQEYLLPLVPPPRSETTKLRSVALFAAAPQPASIEILSVTLVPRGAEFLEDSGVRAVTRGGITRRTIFAHAPASFAFRVAVPSEGRLDLALSCLPGESVEYAASVRPDGGEAAELLRETIDDAGTWRQRSIDLRAHAGRTVELVLEASSPSPGAVAFWGAPVLSGGDRPRRPNVVFYVIDGGGADFMSVYGYNRRTTPFLERLAAEGVVFDRAYSNSTWTQPSTASFMTSLQHSVLGGLRRGIHSTPVPTKAPTMAERMREAGYQTAVLTSNPNCARMIGLERGVDFMRDADAEDSSRSSAELHEAFWRWRADSPGLPYWVHVQTTDVHQPNHPPPPFAGLFVTPEERARLEEWDDKMFQAAGDVFGTTSVVDFYDIALSRSGVDRRSYFSARRGLYDETMAHQDKELERLVERLKAQGEWEDTLLVIGSDHGHPAGTFARFGRGLLEPQPDGWQGALFDAYSTRVPLIVVWPRAIRGGRRIAQPVSMIDVLPTILDLAGLPPLEVQQGRSLAPLLRGEALAPRPVLLDEFRVDEATGTMVGNLEMIDGRWGASLEIAPAADGADPALGRHAIPAGGRWGAVHPYFAQAPRFLLYDLWSDPFATRAVNDEHPELARRYEKELLAHWEVHRALALRFGEAEGQALDPAMVRQLQSLGYTR